MPHLPLELHILILHHAHITTPSRTLLPWLWRSCRAASRLLRAAAEHVFVERHLRHARTGVSFALGEGVVVASGSGATVYGLEVWLGFVGFEDEECSRAVFRDGRAEGGFAVGVLEATRRRWREVVEEASVAEDGSGGDDDAVVLRPEAWSYWVEMRGLALDPELPGLRIDYERREVSFDWRRMLDGFFAEEAYARRRLEELVRRSPFSLSPPLLGFAAVLYTQPCLLQLESTWAYINYLREAGSKTSRRSTGRGTVSGSVLKHGKDGRRESLGRHLDE